MKLRQIITIAALTVVTVANAVTQGNGVITVKASKVMCPLAEQWIKAYNESHPNTKIQLVGKGEEADLTLGNNSEKALSVTVGRVVVLPVTPSDNPLIKELTGKEWSGKDIKRLFFQTDEEQYEDKDRLSKRERIAGDLTVFSGNGSASLSSAFAKHFGFTSLDIRGKRIAGDDTFLINAITRNKQSVTFNSLSNIFDLQSRQVKPSLTLLPLDGKKEQTEILASGDLDKALDLFEKQLPELIVTDAVAFSYNTFNTDIENFLQWVLAEGQEYNHSAGFLKLDSKRLKSELLALRDR